MLDNGVAELERELDTDRQTSRRGVVITGIGLIGPIGNDLDAFWDALLLGRSGIGQITRFDVSSYPCRIGGEVPPHTYEHLLDPRKLRTAAHVTQLALAATELALRDARLAPRSACASRIGVAVGTAVGGWHEAAQQTAILLERGARRVNPFIVIGSTNHSPGVEVASAIGAEGAQATFSSGCPSGLQAIAHGASLIANGELDVVLAGGTESPLTPLVIASMTRTQELCTDNDAPERACRPFDRSHAGMVLSEGSCMLVLESAEHAAERGARAYADLTGWASSCDARGVYGTDPTGDTAARAVHRALGSAGLNAMQIDYVCAHANSSPAFDRKETLVLKRAFGECVGRIAVSSIKSVLGHPFGAAGAFQTAAAALAIQHQVIPPTHNLRSPDEECDLDHVPNEPRHTRIRNALVTSYGYGGVNAYLIAAEPHQDCRRSE